MSFTFPWSRRQADDSVERMKVLSRMHASNVASTLHTLASARSDEDRAEARRRIARKLGLSDGGPNSIADDVLNVVIRHLQNCELTINFKADSFFGRPISGRTYGNCWELGKGTGASTAPERDKAEDKLFAYSEPHVVSAPGYKPVSVAGAIGRHGDSRGLDADKLPQNPYFLAGMRPKYAAVNFQNSAKGAAFKYGDDNFVLKPYVKFNATFTHFDSFQVKSSAEVATYHNMAPIVRYMEDKMLDVLMKESSGIKASPIGYAAYIEAQLHSDVDFGRDVDRVVIPGGVAKLSAKARANLEKFGKKFGLTIDTPAG
jgi:hypothetical protein